MTEEEMVYGITNSMGMILSGEHAERSLGSREKPRESRSWARLG